MLCKPLLPDGVGNDFVVVFSVLDVDVDVAAGDENASTCCPKSRCSRFTCWHRVCVSVCRLVCLSVGLSVSLSVCLSVCPSVRLSVCPSVRLSVCPFVRLYVCPSVRLSVLGSKNGPSSARVCPKGSGPHSAAKQGRSFRVAALNHPVSLCAQGGPSHILQQNRAVLVVWLL